MRNVVDLMTIADLMKIVDFSEGDEDKVGGVWVRVRGAHSPQFDSIHQFIVV